MRHSETSAMRNTSVPATHLQILLVSIPEEEDRDSLLPISSSVSTYQKQVHLCCPQGKHQKPWRTKVAQYDSKKWFWCLFKPQLYQCKQGFRKWDLKLKKQNSYKSLFHKLSKFDCKVYFYIPVTLPCLNSISENYSSWRICIKYLYHPLTRIILFLHLKILPLFQSCPGRGGGKHKK